MRMVCLAAAVLAAVVLPGCGQNTTTAPAPAFELDGTWLYLGPWDGEHTLKIGDASVEYAGINGEWSSDWTMKSYDNGLHHFQIAFKAGTGTYLPSGQSFSAAYVLNAPMLTVQLASGGSAYPAVESPGSCTKNGEERIPDCRLYVKQN